MRTLMNFSAIAMTAVILMGATGCEEREPNARQKNTSVQRSLMERATAAVPVPSVSNFAAREAVAKQITRMDETGKLYYVYLLGQNGQQIGYYVSNTRPVATCTLLTPSEEQVSTGYQSLNVMKAPGLQGTYNPNPGCGSVFFFDAATDAYIEINGMSYFVSDQPLSVKSDPIRVLSEPKR